MGPYLREGGNGRDLLPDGIVQDAVNCWRFFNKDRYDTVGSRRLGLAVGGSMPGHAPHQSKPDATNWNHFFRDK